LPEDFNAKIIAEFRENDGKVGGPFEGAPVLLLHTTGARSGQERVNPMMYDTIGDGFAVFASKGGAPTNPDWFHNLVANPHVTAEIGTETIDLTARVADDATRAPIWDAWKKKYTGFADYETKTSRQIPVVLLDRVS
jgi:deazaflavin-dependent oxidoreductase (nitroreductase family)